MHALLRADYAAPANGSARIHRMRMHALSLCLSAALATPALGAPAAAHVAAKDTRAGAIPHAPLNPLAKTWTVTNCNDSGTGSLRDMIENPMNAQSGDTADLSQLATCTITLSGTEIVVAQDALTLQGPTKETVTISGAMKSRVFHHTGVGTLVLNALSVSGGYYHGVGSAYGGCIESDNGDVSLNHVLVSGCRVVSDNGYGNGGGVSAEVGNVTLIASKISGNEATPGWGGGVYSKGHTIAWYSSISSNTAHDSAYARSFGGGVTAYSGVTLIASTINANIAGCGGGIAALVGATSAYNSTISGNTADTYGGALYAYGMDSVIISNSTIAFNHQNGSIGGAGGIAFHGATVNSSLTLQSSIIADDTSGATNTPTDVYIWPGFGSLNGADNLVMASNVSNPAVITLMADPKLGALQYNGGPTRTHQLLSGSPAVGQGNTAGLPTPWSTTDQRGAGYPRTTGPNASIDLGAVQFDSIFADSFNSPLF